jgi:O-antigen ligase
MTRRVIFFRTDRPYDSAVNLTSRVATVALLLLPGGLTVYLSFNAGGYFPNTVAFVAVLLAAVLVLRAAFAKAALQGSSKLLGLAAGALALYTVWTLVSAVWSDSLGRSLLEFDRAFLYLLALVLFGSIARTSSQIRWIVRGLAVGIVFVCLVALTTRVLPDVWPISPNLGNNRLSYPLTYWNALGLLASLGIVFCFHLTCCLKEPRFVRVLAAGALPPLGATLLFTFSRGGIAAAVIGLVAYVVVDRPRGLVSGLLVAAPTTAVAVTAAYNADLLATDNPTSAAAIDQGQDVALIVALCAAGAISLRWLLLLLDVRLATFRLQREINRPLLASAAVLSVAAVTVALLALHVPKTVGHQYDRFIEGNNVETAGDFRKRLTDPGNNGRVDQWRVAVDGFENAKIIGQGAGTYQLVWARDRPDPSVVTDAHSLYVEVLGELGMVGSGLLALVLLAILIGFGARARGPNRSVFAALLASALAWAFHAGIDWDWEMPVVTLWLFAAGGAVLAAPARNRPLRRLPPFGRALIALGTIAVAIVPILIMVSQARLDDGIDAFRRDDCTDAIAAARSSRSALGMRPQPYQLMGYCEARNGHERRAVSDMQKALDRDPDNWEYHYGLALAQATAGIDPRSEARTALRLNPLDLATQDAEDRFRTENPQTWKREGGELLKLAFE